MYIRQCTRVLLIQESMIKDIFALKLTVFTAVFTVFIYVIEIFLCFTFSARKIFQLHFSRPSLAELPLLERPL